MTVATLTTGLAQTDTTQATQVVRGKIALSGNYGGGATHGDVLNLALYGVQSNYPPLEVRIYEMPPAGTAPTGYEFGYALGADPTSGLLTIIDPTTRAEYTQGSAYSAGLLAAALYFTAIFPLGN